MKNLKYTFVGIMMGIANVIPGVSGGTIALIFNIYDKLMESITLNFKIIRKNIKFILFLALGIIIGILGLSKIMEILFNNYHQQTLFAFIGIILGSLPLIYFKGNQGSKKNNILSIIAFTTMLLLMIILTFTGSNKESGVVLFTSLNIISFIAIFASMALATATMIIPGISGSMILIVLGMYQTIYFEIINNMNIPLLLPALIGAACGLLFGAKLINYLLKKFPKETYMAILGLLVGSIFQLLVTLNITSIDFNLFISILIAIIFTAIIYIFSINEIRKG